VYGVQDLICQVSTLDMSKGGSFRGPEDYSEGGRMHKVLVIQAILILTVGGVFGSVSDVWGAIAAIFGGVIALLNTLLLIWRAHRTDKTDTLSAGENLGVFYLSALERFAMVAMMFLLGLVVLELLPLPMLTGFIVGMLAIFSVGITGRNLNN
jgi:ATP synthase protein I